MQNYDIVVVGGGPIGCFAAQQLASKGIRVAVVEEHKTVGVPLHCAGLVTKRVFDITGCSHDSIVQNKIYGAHIHSPDGTILTIGGEKLHALVIDRQRFDQTLAEAAQATGADLFLDRKVVSGKKQDDTVILSMEDDEHTSTARCHLVIGADGSHSRIQHVFGFPPPTEILHGVGAELSDTMLDPRFVHIFVGQAVAPGFFAWVIPTDTQGSTARIGLCVGKHHPLSLQQYVTSLLDHPLVQGSTVVKRFGGVIPLGPLKKTVDDHVMLVGDAAAQVKPTSGGGLYPGLLCAQQCIKVAVDALHKQQYTENALKPYHLRWTKEIGRELSLGMRFRTLFLGLSDAQFNKYIKKLDNDKTIRAINSYGDIDYPSRLALPLMRTAPSLLSLAPRVLKRTKP
jgi:digeranylgeranylglycerophospholipid reductase